MALVPLKTPAGLGKCSRNAAKARMALALSLLQRQPFAPALAACAPMAAAQLTSLLRTEQLGSSDTDELLAFGRQLVWSLLRDVQREARLEALGLEPDDNGAAGPRDARWLMAQVLQPILRVALL